MNHRTHKSTKSVNGWCRSAAKALIREKPPTTPAKVDVPIERFQKRFNFNTKIHIKSK